MGKKKNNDYRELFPVGEGRTVKFKVTDIELQANPSNLLSVPPKSVNVHLLRYALCKNGENHEGRPLGMGDIKSPTDSENQVIVRKVFKTIGDNEVDFHPENAPKVPGYQYYGAPVREGWLYVYNETTSNWHEYKILPGGEIQTVVWERFTEGYDEREPQKGAPSVTYLKAKPDHVIWLAYSEIQWTSKYTTKVVGSNDLRKKRMQRIDCKSWLSEQKGEDLLSTAEARAEFIEYNGTHNIAHNIYLRDYQLCKALDNSDHHLYAYLHDPLGAANDLADDLTDARLMYECLIKSMQTGAKREELYRHTTEKTPFPILPHSDQLFALHMLTVSLYPLLYDTRNKDTCKHAEHVDKAKFEALLAMEIRVKEKNEIEKIRTALATFMTSDYYVNVVNDAQDNTHTNRLLYLEGYHTRNNVLSIPPAVYDYHLDIHDGSANDLDKNSEVKSYFTSIMEEGSWFDKLAAKEIDYTDLIDKDTGGIANSLSQTWLTLLDAYPTFLTDASGKPKLYNCVARWMENVKILGKKNKIPCWEFENGQFKSNLAAHGFENETPLGKGRYSGYSTVNRPPADMSRAPKITVKLAPKYQQWTEKFLSHSGFKATYRTLSFLNFAFVVSAENEKGLGNKITQISASAIEMGGLLARGLWEYHEQKQAIQLFAKATERSKVFFATQSLRHLGTSVATGISGFLMLYDVIYYGCRRDVPAAIISGFGSAITLSLATIGFAVGIQEMIAIGIFAKGSVIARTAVGILSLISVSGTSASSTALRTVMRYGTKMWVLFIITLIFYILLKIFEKTELEKFIMNCVLSDYRKLPEEMKSKHPAEVMNYFYENKEQLTNKAATPFRDFVFALNYYEELFPPFGMIADRGNYDSQEESITKYVYTMHQGVVYFIFYHTLPEEVWSVDLGLAITDHENVTYNIQWRESTAQTQVAWQKKHLCEMTQPELKSVKIPAKLHLDSPAGLPKSVERITDKMKEEGIPAFILSLNLSKWDEFEKYRNSRFLTLYVYSRLRYGVLWDSEQNSPIVDTADTLFYPKSSDASQAMFSVARVPLRFTLDSIVADWFVELPPKVELDLEQDERLNVIYYKSSEQTIFKERKK